MKSPGSATIKRVLNAHTYLNDHIHQGRYMTCITFADFLAKTLSKQMSRAMRKCVLCHMRTTMAQINLRMGAV